MSRTKKVLLVGLSVILVLLVGVVALVHLLVTPERVKGWVLPVAEEHLHREVTLEDVEIGLLSGIVLKNLKVRDLDGSNDLLLIEGLVLSYRFWPLLSGKLVVDEIIVKGPAIRLVQNADGSMNIDDLLAGPPEDSGAKAPAGEPTGNGEGVDLLVSRVLLEDGSFHLVQPGDGSGDIRLQNLRVLVRDITLDGSFPIEISLRMKETDFRIDGDFQPSASRGRFDLFVKQLDLNRFIPPASEAEPTEVKADKADAPHVELGPIEVPITLDGTVNIDELIYDEVSVKAVRAAYRLADNRFQLEELTGNIADGEFKAKADVDLGKKGFVYNGQFTLQGVDLQALVPVLLPQAERSTHGMMQLNFDFSGTGTDPVQIVKQVASKGSFKLDSGKLMGSPLLVGLAKFLGNPELKVLSFESLSGEYDLQKGVAQVQAALDSSKTRFASSGTVDLDGPLDLKLETRLAPEMLQGLSSDSPLRRAFTDPDGWGVLPLKVAGSLSDPKFSLSSEGVKSQAKEKVKQKLGEKLQEKLGGKESPVQELIDQPLKKLFGD